MIINAYFANGGLPATGLTPTVNIRNVAGTLLVDGASMTELGDGFYIYDFTAFDTAVDYVILCDGGSSLSNTERYAVATTGSSGEITDIKERTDNLSDDPASQTDVEAAIITAEGNIRGADSDDLSILSSQLDTVGAVADAIQSQTDLLPADPASEAAVASAITATEGNITTAISSTESNIRGVDGDTLATLSVQMDTIDTVADAINAQAANIQAKTDLLPSDPASQADVETAITVAETNIRGTDSDTLKSISDQVDGVSAKTDNLPDDPADQSEVETAITTARAALESVISTAESNIRGADSDTLKTVSDHLDAMESKEDIIDTVADAIKAKTDNLPTDPASQASVDTTVAASETNIRGGFYTLEALSTQLDGNLSAIQSIQNNTTRRIDIPTRLIRPDADSKTYRLILGIYDNAGMPEVPDSVPTVQIENIAGVERLAETVMTQYTDQDGQFYYDLAVSASDTLEILIVAIKVVEGGVTSYHRRATEVTEFESDLNEVQANVVAIKTKTDYLPTNTAQELTDIDGAVATAQSRLDDGDSGLAAIKAAVDTVDTVADAIKERTDRLPDAPASEGNVNSVRAKTDYLPTDTAQEFTDIDSAIANSESNITSLLNDASSGLVALKALIDNVDTSAELADRFTEIKGTGWVDETLVQLDGLLDAIKAKTDQLPANTAQELTDIDTEIAGVRAKTDALPVDTASELDAIDTEITGVRTKTDQLPVNTAQELENIDTEIAGVRAKTDNLPADTALELGAIDTEIAATRERTNRLPDDPADQSLVQDALDAAESRINTDLDELIARDTGQSVELASIHSDLLSVKERTDYLPANLVSSIDQINTKLSQLSSGDGGVSADEIQTMLNALNEDLTDLLSAMQSDVTFIRDIEGGRWRIVGTQMVFFKEDNATEIARFNLYNASGTESATSVYERRRA